jgi:uncharacterized protein YjbI with pentapeptide repeats
MTNETISSIILVVLGWFLGLISSIVLFWVQEKRDARKEALRQRQEDTRAARNWAADGKKISLRGFDLAGANLSGKDLSGADLEDANLEGAQMWGTDLSGANLRRANFRKARMIGVNFTKATLKFSDFSDVKMGECDFTEADFRKAKLKQAKTIDNCIWRSIKVDETTELTDELRQQIEKSQVA